MFDQIGITILEVLIIATFAFIFLILPLGDKMLRK